MNKPENSTNTEEVKNESQQEATVNTNDKKANSTKKIALIIAPVVLVIVVFAILLTVVIIPDSKYNDAVALMNAGKYEEAIEAFEALNGYKDSADKIENCNAAIIDDKYEDAVALMNAGNYTEAIAAFEALNGYKDSAAQIENCIINNKYNDAVALMNAGSYTEAIAAFEELNGFKDSADKIENCYINLYGEDLYNKLQSIKIGDIYTFGAYEQDNDLSNGKEAIEWIVIDKKGSSICLLSKYALDGQQYSRHSGSVTWQTSSIRTWLNDTFLNEAFSQENQAMIPTVTVSADKNPSYDIYPGGATEDKIFLLSVLEADKYASIIKANTFDSTPYARSHGASAWWWLRSPGDDYNRAANFDGNRGTDRGGNYANDGAGAIRPALWIDLNS